MPPPPPPPGAETSVQRQTPSLRIAAILILHQLARELRLIRKKQMRKLGDIAVDLHQMFSDFLGMGQNQRLLQIVHGPDLSLRRQLIKLRRESADEVFQHGIIIFARMAWLLTRASNVSLRPSAMRGSPFVCIIKTWFTLSFCSSFDML